MRNQADRAIHAFILWSFFLATALAAPALVAAAQVTTAPLTLTVTFEPPTPAQGEQLTFTFEIQNVSEMAVQQVQLDVTLPEGTLFHTAIAGDTSWMVRAPIEGQGWMVGFEVGELAAQATARLSLVVTIEQENGQSVVLDEYTLTAQGFDSPVAGESIAIPIAAATNAPAPTATQPKTAAPSPTPQPTATTRPSPTPSPSPTVTVVMAELPPTPTPKLSTEKEELGALTVSIFIFLTLAIALAAALWVFRKSRERG